LKQIISVMAVALSISESIISSAISVTDTSS
jgi:hypothetical protein